MRHSSAEWWDSVSWRTTSASSIMCLVWPPPNSWNADCRPSSRSVTSLTQSITPVSLSSRDTSLLVNPWSTSHPSWSVSAPSSTSREAPHLASRLASPAAWRGERPQAPRVMTSEHKNYFDWRQVGFHTPVEASPLSVELAYEISAISWAIHFV